MKRAHKTVVAGIAAVGLCAALVVSIYGLRLAAIGAAYKAKIVCSGVFVSHREVRSLLDTDVSADDLSLLRYFDVRVDRDAREVSAAFLGLVERTAVYRVGRGCALVPREPGDPTLAGAGDSTEGRSEQKAVVDIVPTRESAPPALDRTRMNAALKWAFSEPEPALPRRTRAVVVLYKGQVVAEGYAHGFTKDTPLLGWSMTKSVVNALVGVLVREGNFSLDDSVPIPEWRGADDPRRNVTWNQLLQMSSGLRFDEDYSNPLSDTPYMLLGAPDAAAYAAAKPLETEPGARWSYSSGSTNIIAYAIRQTVGDANYPEFPRRALFDRLGMKSALMETDAAGNFVGSSFMYATARDWARFGLLYLYDGVWAGQRVLPEGWVAYTRSPALRAPDQKYGAHFWLQIPEEYRCGSDARALPEDAFHAIGHEGQFITIIPSRELVLVRLGFSRYPCAWDHRRFVQLVLEAIGEGKPGNTAPDGTR